MTWSEFAGKLEEGNIWRATPENGEKQRLTDSGKTCYPFWISRNKLAFIEKKDSRDAIIVFDFNWRTTMSNETATPQGQPNQPQPAEPPVAQLAGPVQVMSPPPAPRRSVWSCLGIIFLFILLVISCAGNIFLGSALMGASALGEPLLAVSPLQERFIDGDPEAKEKILIVNVEGPIISGSESVLFLSKFDIVADTIAAFKRAEEDHDVRAIILQVDSPGGSITACEQILDRIKRFRKARKDVPIIAFMGSIAASGGYYISAQADFIMCHSTTITGSIGVIMQLLNYEGLFEKIGLKGVTIKSADKKDIASGLRQMTEEEKKLLHGMIMEMYDRFVTVVDEGRKNLDRESVMKLADGSIFTGKQAKENGLVDELGFFEDAVEETKKLGRIERARIVEYRKRPTIFELLTMKAEQDAAARAGIAGDLKRLINERTPRFMYLWTME